MMEKAGFAYSDPAVFVASGGGEATEIELRGSSSYLPPFRSPLSIALFPDDFADFDLEFEALQTGPEYAHRDLCVFFAFESPSRFAYVHFASKPDANAHNVFVVDGAPRRNLLPPRERGVEWGDAVWHRIRVVRAGTIVRAYFGDGAEPLFETEVPLGAGRVGVGSFDDSGRFRAIRLRGERVAEDRDDPFR